MTVTNEQLNIVVGIPMLSNAVVTGLGIAFLKTKFDTSDKRYADMRDRWRAQLRRTKDMNEARRKQIEGGANDTG
jgi:hypothetical protein